MDEVGDNAACACVCVAAGIMVPIIYNNNMHQKSDSQVSEEGMHSGLQTVENPVYEVIHYQVPDEYEFTTLYVATTSETESYFGGSSFAITPVLTIIFVVITMGAFIIHSIESKK